MMSGLESIHWRAHLLASTLDLKFEHANTVPEQVWEGRGTHPYRPRCIYAQIPSEARKLAVSQ